MFHLQIEKIFAAQGTMCRLKFHLQIEELFGDQRIICTSKNYLQIEELPTYRELTADQTTI